MNDHLYKLNVRRYDDPEQIFDRCSSKASSSMFVHGAYCFVAKPFVVVCAPSFNMSTDIRLK